MRKIIVMSLLLATTVFGSDIDLGGAGGAEDPNLPSITVNIGQMSQLCAGETCSGYCSNKYPSDYYSYSTCVESCGGENACL